MDVSNGKFLQPVVPASGVPGDCYLLGKSTEAVEEEVEDEEEEDDGGKGCWFFLCLIKVTPTWHKWYGMSR
jgi:hypothetical protein